MKVLKYGLCCGRLLHENGLLCLAMQLNFVASSGELACTVIARVNISVSWTVMETSYGILGLFAVAQTWNCQL